MTSQPGKQTVAKNILPNILRSKANKTMKFVQLIEYNIRDVFLEKPYTKSGGKTIPRSFSKKWKWACLWINSLKFYTLWFYCILSWGLSKDIETKLQTKLAFTSYKAVLKNKKLSRTCLPASFSARLKRSKIFLLLCYINWPYLIICVFLLRDKSGSLWIAILFVSQIVTS